jgi:hypothetical protein
MVRLPIVVAVIGDVVRSKQLEPSERAAVQSALERVMLDTNSRYRDAVLADFLITLGDEFQGMVRQPEAIPEIVQNLREQLPKTRFRIAVSHGELTTPLKPVALGTDGPVWHAARRLLDEWRKAKRDGVGFIGFAQDDVVLNGIAALLTYHWTHLEDSQREILTALRDQSDARKQVAERIGISQQALSNRAQSAGWREYDAGMTAWRAVLRRHTPQTAVA